MSGRSDHCPDFLYDEAQHARNTATGKPPNFLWLDALMSTPRVTRGVAPPRRRHGAA